MTNEKSSVNLRAKAASLKFAIKKREVFLFFLLQNIGVDII